MKTKRDEREALRGVIGTCLSTVIVIFIAYVLYTANPAEMVQEYVENVEAKGWNEEISEKMTEEVSEGNQAVLQAYEVKKAEERAFVEQKLEEVRTSYLNGEEAVAESLLRALCTDYSSYEKVLAYMELFNTRTKTLGEKDMYDWKQMGKPLYGDCNDYMYNRTTGFIFSSNDIWDGEYGFFLTKGYTKVTIDAATTVSGMSETIEITVTDLITEDEWVLECPRVGLSKTFEKAGGNIKISVPESRADCYGSVIVSITVEKTLTEQDFDEIDLRFM